MFRPARRRAEADGNSQPRPFNGRVTTSIHPNVVRDVLNDTSFNGLSDIIKRDDSMRKMLFELPSNEDTISFAGVTFKQTSTAPTVTISGNTYYNTYIFGDDAIFSVFLGKNPNDGSKNYLNKVA
jgi:hypothetical protein